MVDEAYEKEWGTHPKVTVDNFVVMQEKILLIQRRDSGLWAMPGGFLEPGETLYEGAIRELLEETGIDMTFNNQDVRFYGSIVDDDPDRDPRTHIITHIHMFMREFDSEAWLNAKGEDDAIQARWFTPPECDELKFYASHDELIGKAIYHLLTYNRS